MRWFLFSALIAGTALAGPRGRTNGNFRLGSVWVGNGTGSNHAAPRVVYQPVYVPLAWWTWYPIQPQVQPAPPPPPPEPIVDEREVVREVPAPAPQVIIIEREVAPSPTPAVAPAPPPPVPAPEVARPPPAPRVPGPDVYTWEDADGLVHFSTRVPSEAKARAKKVGGTR